MRNYVKRHERVPTVSITSLIDIIFMLVIFFMISSTFDKTAVPVSLPASSTSTNAPVHTLGVTVDRTGVVYVNDHAVSDSELSSEIRSALSKESNKNAVLYSDEAVPLGKIVKIMDAMNSGGVENVAVKTSTAAED